MRYTQCPKCGSRELGERWEATVDVGILYDSKGKVKRRKEHIRELHVHNETYCLKCPWTTDDELT